MTFTTLTFLLFLGIVLWVYWSLPARGTQNLLLLLASYSFYSWWDPRFCALMAASSLIDFGVGLGLGQCVTRGRRRVLLAVSLIANLGLLGFFKYYNFFVESAGALLGSLGVPVAAGSLEIVLPVGISFYTFQTMSYSFDVYRRKLPPTRALVDYLAYVSFFPQLVAGPIERGSHFLPQFLNERRFDRSHARDGCRQILWGLCKKLALADGLGAYFVDPVYGDIAGHNGSQLAFATLAFGLQIYCDFSAYSDIAIGTARLFGFELMRNFAYPYFSRSVGEFWRRWHISLSTWFRDYLYIPLGGSRVGPARRGVNVMVTFLVSGLWHGASWNFVVWGGIHGLALLPEALRGGAAKVRTEDVPGGEANLPGLRTVLRIVGTLVVVHLAWIFFRADSLGDGGLALQRIAVESLDPRRWGSVLNVVRAHPFGTPTAVVTLLFLWVEWRTRRRPHPLQSLDRWPRPLRWTLYTLLLWAALSLGAQRSDPFIYFQF